MDITGYGYCCDLCKAFEPNIKENLNHCGECNKYLGSTFNQRQGLLANEVKEKLGESYDASKYNEYLLACDNKSRVGEYKKNKF